MECKSVNGLIDVYCDSLKELLHAKNHDYGNSIFKAPEFCPNCSAEEAIWIRIGDKVNRLKKLSRSSAECDESMFDTEMDLAGYLILLQVAKEMK